MKAEITQEELENSFHNTNFGINPNYRELVNEAVCKIASGYRTGHTMSCILVELGLQRSPRPRGPQLITSKGKKYMDENSLSPLKLI